MSEISEGLGEFGQGALAANAVEPAAGGKPRDGHTHEKACLNCGTRLVGPHCHACGQAAHVHRTLGAFWHDLLHGVLHFEGKVWRTLPLVVWRPGKLTREYIDGRRASYISPIALFLLMVFLMFAVFHATESTEKSTPRSAETTQDIAELRADIARLQQSRAAARTREEGTGAIDRELQVKREALDVLEDMGGDGIIIDTDGGPDLSGGLPPVERAVRTFRANPELAAYKLQTYAYKYSWALIPISVPFLWLLFPFSRRFHLYDHTVFVTYSLCFMTLLVIAAMLARTIGMPWLSGLLFFVPPFHMYRQLRETYAVGRAGALWRTALLVLFASAALLIFFLLIMAQTAS